MRARRRFGQHYLQAAWVRKVVDAVAPRPGEVFLEIGPGAGALTFALASHPVSVVALELDRDLVAALKRAAPPNVEVIAGDVLETDLGGLARKALEAPWPADPGGPRPERARLVGNLPYNISSPILLRLAALARTSAEVSDATVMLQEEVAQRVLAAPGSRDYGPLAIAMQQRFDARLLMALPPGAFRPIPKVRSSLVSLTFRPIDVELTDEELFDAVVRAVFTQRRKTLANALRPFATSRGLDSGLAISGAGLDERRRPETLSRAEFGRLANVLAAAKPLPVL